MSLPSNGAATYGLGASLGLALIHASASLVAPTGDLVFVDGFDGAQPSISNYDDLIEGLLGTSIDYNGVSYHDVNGIGGVFPDGSTFTANDVGDQLIIEDATDFYGVHPDYGSAPNSLTFGDAYVPGPNLSLGAMVRVSMDLAEPANAATVDIGYYENGPWGGIEIHLDALDAGTVVASDVLTIADGGGRDNDTIAVLSVSAASFDSLKLYATYNDQPSAPRVIMDDLALTPVLASP
ncbi:MAG TPA: hypothetical protein VGO25_11080 [Rhodanobacteraceae bacterium]|jgi:hypothetical protein|nr:hypothetical protein [Rhodanobacteraceae bacterium]